MPLVVFELDVKKKIPSVFHVIDGNHGVAAGALCWWGSEGEARVRHSWCEPRLQHRPWKVLYRKEKGMPGAQQMGCSPAPEKHSVVLESAGVFPK